MFYEVLLETFIHFVFYWSFGCLIEWYKLSDSSTWKCRVLQEYSFVLFNQFVTLPLVLFILYPYMRTDISTSSYTHLVFGFIFVYVFECVWFYWIHRLFHTRMFFRWHKYHHGWIEPISFSAEDCSFLEHFMLNLFPVLLAPTLIGWPFVWIRLWSLLATYNSLVSHSAIPGEFPSHHVLHHRYFNVNYGIGTWMDSLFDTLKTVY